MKLTPRTTDEGGQTVRVTLTISAADEAAFGALPNRSARWLTVTDTATGKAWKIRHASCGSGCYCDAVARQVTR